MLVHTSYLVPVMGAKGDRFSCFSTSIVMEDTYHQSPTFMTVKCSRNYVESWKSTFVTSHHEYAEAK